MNLFLIAYANAAVVVPGLWIGARLLMLRRPRHLVTAQIIPFPARRALKPMCARQQHNE